MSNMEHEIKRCLQKIRSGDIRSSVKEVESLLKNENQADVAINVLLQTSSSITSGNLQDSTTAFDVFKISQTCCVYLESDFKHDEVKYLSALHHILKYLIQKGNLVDACIMMNYLCIVKQDDFTDDDTVAKILYATYYFFRSRLMEELQCSSEVQSQLKFLKDTVNILMCCGTKYLSIIVDHAGLFLKFIESKTYNNNFNDLFHHTLDILELYLTCKNVARNVNSKIATKCANIILQLALKCIELDSYELVCKIVSVLVSSELNFNSESPEAHCFKLFRLTLSTFASDHKISQEILKELSNYLVIVVSKYGANDMVGNVCVYITLILSTTHKKWLNWGSAEWMSQWKLHNIGCLHKIIITVIQMLKNFRANKRSITQEEISIYLKNIVYTILLQLIILSTSRYYLSNCSEVPEKLVLNALDAFNECIPSITELKQREFPSWTSYWTNIVFEILKICQELTNHELWLLNQKFYAALCKTFVNLGDTGQQSYSVKNGTLNSFIGYIKASLSLKEYEKALSLCAVALVLLPGNKKKIFNCWGNAKLSGISEGFFELEKYSLLNFFQEEHNICFSEFPSLKWDSAIIEEYFIAELEYYCKYGVGMFNCLYAVSKDCLRRLSNSVLNARGTELLLDAACSQEDVKILQNCYSIGKETLNRVLQCKHVSTNVEKFKLLILLGNLHYRIFLIDLVMIQVVQKERIEYIESSAPKMEPKDDKDLEENVYNVTSEYENLSIEREAKLVQQLNTAVHYWLQLLDLEKYADMEYLKILIENIENVAYLYGLFGCVTHEINVWGLYYKLNNILGSDTGKLQAVSFILRLGNFESEHLLKDFEGIAQNLEIDNKCKAQQISFYCHYLLGKSWMSLKNLQLEIGATYLVEVKNLIAESSEYEHKLLLAECYYLLSKYLSISNWNVPPQVENELSLSCGYTAFWIVKYLVGQKRRSIVLRTRLLYITLKLVEWLTEMHIALRWNAEIFNILKEILVTFQVAVLPIRSSQILAYMAEIRLMEKDVNDCKSKMMSLEKILNLKSYKMADDALNELKNNVQKLKVSSTDRVDSIFHKHVKLANFNLDKDVRAELICSSRASKWNEWFNVASTGSPDFRKKVPKVYRAMSHQDNCRCYMCQNFASHTVVIHYYYIIALFTELVQCVENIIPTYEAGLLSSLCLYEKETKQIATLNETFIEVTDFNITFSEIQDQFKIYYTKYISLFSDYLASYKIFREASDLNTEAICCQETVKGPKTFYLRDTYVVKYGLTIFQLCNSETVGNNYEETLRILLDEKTVARIKKLGEHLRTPQLKLKCAKNLFTPKIANSFFQECKNGDSFKNVDKNEDQFNKKMKQLIFDSSCDSEDDFLYKDIPEIIITNADNIKTENKTTKKPNVPKEIPLNKNNFNVPPKNRKTKKNNFLVYVSPGEDIKLTRKKEKRKVTLDSSTDAKIKDQNNDPVDDLCDDIKNSIKNNMQRKDKNVSNPSKKSTVRNKPQKTTSLIFESSEEEIELDTETLKLNSFHNFSLTNKKTHKTNLKILYSSSDEETFPIKSIKPTKIGKPFGNQLTRKKEKRNVTLDSSTNAKIKDQNNDPVDLCDDIKNAIKNNMQGEDKNVSNPSKKSTVRKKPQKTTSLIFESSEEEIELDAETLKLNSFHNFSLTNKKTCKTNLKIFYSSSDEETFPIKSINPTKIGKPCRNQLVKEVPINKVKKKDKSDSQKSAIKQKNCEKSNTKVKESRTNKEYSSKITVTLKSKTRVHENETNTSHTTNKKTNKCDSKLPDDNHVKPSRSVSKVVSASDNSIAKEPPSRRVTRKKI